MAEHDSSQLEQIRALHAAGRSAEALSACHDLLRAQPERADVLAMAGTLALKLGALDEAEAALSAAVELEPRSLEALFNWGNSLKRLGRRAEAIEAFSRALELRPDFVPALNNLGNALYESKQLAAAAATFQRALQLLPDAAHLHRNLGTTLREQGNSGAAQSCFRRANALRPGWVKALQSLATTAMELGDWRSAADACQSWLEQQPANVEALGLRSIALDELGETSAADQLLNFEQLVHLIQLSAPPPGYGSLVEFNAALSAQALTHPSLHVPAVGDPRYHCRTLKMSGEFCVDSRGASARLAPLVEQAILAYVAELRQRLPTHPFVAGGAQRFSMKSWATVLDGEGSLQPHVHYASYVSAVYYPKVPSRMASEPPGAGFLEFGGGPTRFPCRVSRAVRSVEPREGLLVLFPSYFYHRTAPFSAPEPRIAIAFDTVPLL